MTRAGPPLAAGAVGTALIALGATGVGALPPDPSGRTTLVEPVWLGLPVTPGRPLALGLCVAGLLLLCLAWWASRSLGPTAQLRSAAAWSVPLLLAPPLLSRDLYAYAGQAALVVEGLDPYAVGPSALPGPLVDGVDDVWRDNPSPYGPVFLSLAGLVLRVTGDGASAAVLGQRVLAVVGVLLVAWALPRLATACGVPVGRALWLGLANPLVLLHLVGGGHNDALMVGLLVAGLAVALTVDAPWRLVAAAALVALGVLVKAPAVVGLAYLPLTVPGGVPARLRAAAVVGITALATALVVATATGLGWGWLGTLTGGRERLSLFSPLTGLGVALPGGDAALDAVLLLGLVAAATVSLLLLVRAGRRPGGVDRSGGDPAVPATSAPRPVVLSLGLTLLVVGALLPVVQPWYLLWGVIVLAAVVGPRPAAALAVASLALCLTVAPSGRSVVRPPLYGLPTLLAAAAGALVLRQRAVAPEPESPVRPTRPGPVGPPRPPR